MKRFMAVVAVLVALGSTAQGAIFKAGAGCLMASSPLYSAGTGASADAQVLFGKGKLKYGLETGYFSWKSQVEGRGNFGLLYMIDVITTAIPISGVLNYEFNKVKKATPYVQGGAGSFSCGEARPGVSTNGSYSFISLGAGCVFNAKEKLLLDLGLKYYSVQYSAFLGNMSVLSLNISARFIP
ncbi:MAG: hypothetical protein PHN74_00110 [Candidatus Pacebacteria bacterium]|nr:hypothetical protein [Candidatus Paceibacterota bacterium]